MKTYGRWWIRFISVNIIYQTLQLTVAGTRPLLSTQRWWLLPQKPHSSALAQYFRFVPHLLSIHHLSMIEWLNAISHIFIQEVLAKHLSVPGLVLGAGDKNWVRCGFFHLGTQSEGGCAIECTGVQALGWRAGGVRPQEQVSRSRESKSFEGQRRERLVLPPRIAQRPHNGEVMWPRSWEIIFVQLEK